MRSASSQWRASVVSGRRLLLSTLLLLTACSNTSPLVGTWVLLEEDIRPDAPPLSVSPEELASHSCKVINEDHFAFGGQDASGRVWAGGGTYTYHDGEYVETIDYHSIPELVGQTITFECQLDGDLWYHDGRTKVGSREFHIRETWLRWRATDGD